MTAEEAVKAKPAKAAKAVKPKAATTTRMRVYGGGMSLAFGASFLAFGYQLLNGVDAFTAAVWAFFTFFAIGVVSWFMALTLGPALDEAAKHRTLQYVASVSAFPTQGAIPSSRGLMGGVDPSILAPNGAGRGGRGAGGAGGDGDFQDLASLLREGSDSGPRGGR